MIMFFLKELLVQEFYHAILMVRFRRRHSMIVKGCYITLSDTLFIIGLSRAIMRENKRFVE
ncbi:hypothetical protein AQ505_08890 [Pedobacter sp. PACM 27299]|nr:hypothetical protein AQ505_08890 [Pedobacter sp. PACM 27299]